MIRRIGNGSLVAITTALGGGILVACNFIAGVGDFAVGSGDDAGGSPDLDSATPGLDAGDAGDSGALDAAPGDGQTPMGDGGCGSAIPTTSPAFQQLLNGCLLWNACSPAGIGYVDGVGECVTLDVLHANANDDRLGCILNAASCADVKNCVGWSWATTTQCPATATSPTTGTCSGSLAISCPGGDYTGYVEDCTKIGGACGVYQEDAGTQAGCVVAATCTGTAAQCGGVGNGLSYTCIDGVGYGAQCTAFGSSVCDYAGGAGCDSISPVTCNGEDAGVAACQGSTYTWCSGDTNTLFSYKCATAGGTCTGDWCAQSECPNPNDCTESCNDGGAGNFGTVANICVGGATVAVNCAGYVDAGLAGNCQVQTLARARGRAVTERGARFGNRIALPS